LVLIINFTKVQNHLNIVHISKATRNIYLLFFLLVALVVAASSLSENEIQWKGLWMVLVFYLLIFAVGVWAGKKIEEDSPDSFLLAGRKMPLWIAMLTMAATWLGGGYINGTAEAAAESGLVWVQAPWGYGLSLIIGGVFFARKMRRYQFRTMLDPLTQRFGERATGLFFIPAVLGEIFWVAAILTALGTTFSVIIGLETQAAIVVSALIAILYTTVGGLWSVAYTDIIQLGLLVFGLMLVVPFLLTGDGGMQQVWVDYQEKFGADASIVPSITHMGDYFWNWLDIALLLIFGGIPWQVYFQRVLAARNEKTAMWLSIFAGIICMIVAVPAALIGMVGAVTDWTLMGLPGPENGASVLPYVLQYLTPEWVALIGLGAIAAAVMSSIDSSMLSSGTMASWNVYKPLVKPDISAIDLKKIVRRSIVVVGVAATILSLRVDSVYALWYLCSDLVYCLLFPALVAAMWDPKANKIGALAGFFVAAFLRFGGGDPTLGLPVLLSYPMVDDGIVLFPFRTLAMVAGLTTIFLVSRMTSKWSIPQPLRHVISD
jgi:high affinity choline transporter 7